MCQQHRQQKSIHLIALLVVPTTHAPHFQQHAGLCKRIRCVQVGRKIMQALQMTQIVHVFQNAAVVPGGGQAFAGAWTAVDAQISTRGRQLVSLKRLRGATKVQAKGKGFLQPGFEGARGAGAGCGGSDCKDGFGQEIVRTVKADDVQVLKGRFGRCVVWRRPRWDVGEGK